jgi:hypothetical protein
VGTNSPDFIKPVSQRKGGIEALFAKQAAKGKRAPSASPNKQGVSSTTSIPSTSKDGGPAEQAIDVDASPQSSPSSDNGQWRTQKRTMAGEPEGTSPKKRMKNTGSE